MSAVNKISKYNLETRVRELNENGTSLRDIADILTSESGHQISKDSVFSFLRSDVKHKAEVIENKTQLQVAVTEAEISTISQRREVIEGLLDMAKDKGIDPRVRVKAYTSANDALVSLDERLGLLSPKNGPTFTQNNFSVNNVKELSDAELIRIIEHGQ